jgi:hypothetical protein
VLAREAEAWRRGVRRRSAWARGGATTTTAGGWFPPWRRLRRRSRRPGCCSSSSRSTASYRRRSAAEGNAPSSGARTRRSWYASCDLGPTAVVMKWPVSGFVLASPSVLHLLILRAAEQARGAAQECNRRRGLRRSCECILPCTGSSFYQTN